MKIAALVVAAGRGTRAGGGEPKQWRALGRKTVVAHALHAFVSHAKINRIVLVVHADDMAALPWPTDLDMDVVTGGETRSASVQVGLDLLDGEVDLVLIHDGARPCVTHTVIDGVIEALRNGPAAAPALKVVDALWSGADGAVDGVVDRTHIFRAQTPQGFDLASIIAAYRDHPDGGTDDVAVARAAGLRVAITAGDEDNLKITTPDDFARAEHILRTRDGY